MPLILGSRALVVAVVVGCTAGKITVGDAGPDTDLTGTADTDPRGDSDPGLADTDSSSVDRDTDLADAQTPTWDDDGDCSCEIAPCKGSSNRRCTDLRGGDCDDSRADVLPDATERCNGRDDNCADGIDEAGATGGSTFFPDNDGDGFGAPGPAVEACAAPPATVANADDCYDANADAHPGATDWHTADRGDGSFDYDCDKNEGQQHADRYQCHYNCAWGLVGGWTGQVPACGDWSDWGDGCEWSGHFSATMPYCAPTANSTALQGCR